MELSNEKELNVEDNVSLPNNQSMEEINSNNSVNDGIETPAVESANEAAEINSDVENAVSEIHEEIPTVQEHENHHEENELSEIAEESFLHLSRKELIEKLRILSEDADVMSKKNNIRAIREAFITISKDEINKLKSAFYAKKAEMEEADEEEFKMPEDPLREKFSDLMKLINQKIQKQIKEKEIQLQKNLADKKNIIDEIKKIVDDPAFNFKEVTKIHELQSKWREIGYVPNSDADNLWESYKFHIQRFYDKLSKDRELKELDFKKNFQEKKLLCEAAEDLIVLESINEAVSKARLLMNKWKEIGAVKKEDNEAVWQRFTAAIDKVYERQKQYFDSLKESHTQNLNIKNEIVEIMKSLVEELPVNHAGWVDKSEKADKLMEIWKNTGFASKEENEAVWKRFKEQRDIFYHAKEKFYAELRQRLTHNLKLKQDMCEQVEKLAVSTDWKNTTNIIRKIQEQWKTVGPIPKKHSEKVWQRFRKACDEFFENKKLNFAEEEQTQQQNLGAKNELIAKIEAFSLFEDNNETIQELKKFQNEWMAIGHVPFKEKEALNKRYKDAIDAKFNQVKSRVGENNKMLMQMRIKDLQNSSKGNDKLKEEKQKLRDKISRINAEIIQLENNSGFFAKSKNAEEILKDVNAKIANLKKETERLKAQIRMIDETVNPKKENTAEDNSNVESEA